MCPGCCNAFKRGGLDYDIPVGTQVTIENVTIRNKSKTSILPPVSPGELIRNQMTMLTEQLSDAVSTVAKYHAVLASYSRKFEKVSERLIKLELSSGCLCHCVESGPRVTDKPTTSKELMDERKCRSQTKKLVVNEDNITPKEATYAAVSLVSNSRINTLHDDTFYLAKEGFETGEWQEVRNRKKRFSSVRGTAGPEVSTLRAVKYRKYIYLWNMASGADEIRAYLQHLSPLKTCTCC